MEVKVEVERIVLFVQVVGVKLVGESRRVTSARSGP